ncbi:MAG: hypothetical protein IIB56_03810 [Planctomycetes bacterium]|nr:hypothetical protein [Planctomycetota bacterium]MCH8120329.1 hypothetical protein [Planctomycetota bacterium]
MACSRHKDPRLKTDFAAEDTAKKENGFPLPAFAGTSFAGMTRRNIEYRIRNNECRSEILHFVQNDKWKWR